MYRVRTGGYTLLEVIVVLILLSIAAAVVAPSLLSPSPDQASSLRAIISNAREAAVRRGEMVRLHIDRSGAWQAIAEGSAPGERLMVGQLSDTRGAADLLFSPLGTCAPSPETLVAPAFAEFDPLTCEGREE